MSSHLPPDIVVRNTRPGTTTKFENAQCSETFGPNNVMTPPVAATSCAEMIGSMFGKIFLICFSAEAPPG